MNCCFSLKICFVHLIWLRRNKEEKERMLGIFKKNLVNPPKELNSDASNNLSTSINKQQKQLPQDTLNHFVSSYLTGAFSFSFPDQSSFLAYAPPESPYPINRYVPTSSSVFNFFLIIIFITGQLITMTCYHVYTKYCVFFFPRQNIFSGFTNRWINLYVL